MKRQIPDHSGAQCLKRKLVRRKRHQAWIQKLQSFIKEKYTFLKYIMFFQLRLSVIKPTCLLIHLLYSTVQYSHKQQPIQSIRLSFTKLALNPHNSPRPRTKPTFSSSAPLGHSRQHTETCVNLCLLSATVTCAKQMLHLRTNVTIPYLEASDERRYSLRK